MKYNLFSALILLAIFLYSAEFSISFKPFSIKFGNLLEAVSIIVIMIGVIMFSTNMYKKGLEKGIKDTQKAIMKEFDLKKKGDLNKNV